ncbi:MatE family protein [Tritrichomonas foetus]|uniref:MatE family protein n=1 Tax=Tritrichomonas foetus TaxID=1144522 RepID=A0A1J4K4V4_9EUKA|nr:MatE family protein [Tritrichomonas foetus]|eukprot:OHT06423.1 MatE family protein [Tritrichomonas foetus]
MHDLKQPLKADQNEIIDSCCDRESPQSYELKDGQAKAEKPGKVIDEHYRLGGRKPLPTLAILTFGPLVSQLVAGLYGVVSSMWVAKAMGDVGMAAISCYSNLDNIGRAFGFFMLAGASSKISSLFGENKGEEAAQVICDLFRCCFICGMIVPAILVPLSRPLAHWYNAEDEVIDLAFVYLTPLSACSSITCIYLLFCGCLQAEGRSLLVGGIQIASLVANMCLFCPLFLLVFKWGTIGAAFATVCSELIPAVVLSALYFSGRFAVKPSFKGLFKKFSPHTIPALTVGISQLIMNLSRSVPSIFLRKFMGMCADNRKKDGLDGTFEDAVSGFNAVTRIYGVTDAVRMAVSMGLLPSVSYAFSAHRFSRIYKLIFHACWINIVWSTSMIILTAFGSRYVAMCISTSERYLTWAAPMLKIANWEAPLAWTQNVVQTILQAVSYGNLATAYSFFAALLTYIAGLFILYYTNDRDFVRMMYVFLIRSGIALVVGVIILYWPFKKIMKAKEHDKIENDEEEPSIDNIQLNDIEKKSTSSENDLNDNENAKENINDSFIDNV